MDNLTRVLVQDMIYDMSKEEVLKELDKIIDSNILYVFAYNYNWDNGFEIPRKILERECCELSTALMIFYAADGIRYLENKEEDSRESMEWFKFIKLLYNKIVNKEFIIGDIKFIPPLNKIQIFKLRKKLKECEMIFTEELGESDLNISL